MTPLSKFLPIKAIVTSFVVVGFALPLVYCLLLAPFLDVSRTSLVNMNKLPVLVTNLDGPASPIGVGLLSFVRSALAAGSPLPGYRIIDAPGNMSETDIHDAVRGASIWAAVYVSRGASAALLAAVGNASTGAVTAAYNPSNAIRFVYDEGRSPLVAPSRVIAPTRQLLLTFVSTFATSWTTSLVSQPSGASVLTAVARNAPSLLTAPVKFSEESLFPSSKLTVTSNALTVGCILIAVLSLGIAKLSTRLLPMSGDRNVEDDLVPVSAAVLSARALVMLLGGGMLGVCYAVLVVGIGSQTGSVFTGGGDTWAQLAAAQWLTACCFTFFLGGVIACVGQDNVSTVFLLIAYSNALAGWNLDLADDGYVFFQYAPLYHIVRLLRYILYGSLAGEVGSHVGALVAWTLISICWYVCALYAMARLRAWLAARAAKAATPTSAEEPVKAPRTEVVSLPPADAAPAADAAAANASATSPIESASPNALSSNVSSPMETGTVATTAPAAEGTDTNSVVVVITSS